MHMYIIYFPDIGKLIITSTKRYIADWLCQCCYIARRFFKLVKAAHIVTRSSATGSKLIKSSSLRI